MSAGFGSPPDSSDGSDKRVDVPDVELMCDISRRSAPPRKSAQSGGCNNVSAKRVALKPVRMVLPFARVATQAPQPRERRLSVGAKPGETEPTSARKILPFRAHDTHQLSIGINDYHGLRLQFSESCCEALRDRLHALLQSEFSARAVTREGSLFRVCGKNRQMLLAGILRVQVHAGHLTLPQHTLYGEAVSRHGVRLVWGMGTSAVAAERDRRQQWQRRYRWRSGVALG